MKMNWSEMKEEIFSLMFIDDSDKSEYEKAMIPAVNYAIRELSLEVSPDICSVEVCVTEPENLLGERMRKSLYTFRKGDRTAFCVNGCASIAFRYKGEGTLRITANGKETVYELKHTDNFTDYYVGLAERAYVTAEFTSEDKLLVKDTGFYAYGGDDVSPYDKFVRFDMNVLTDNTFAGLYEIHPVKCVAEDDVYEDYYYEKPASIYFDRDKSGVYRIYYYKAPEKITKHTPGSEEISLSYEAAKLVCLYAAWRLLKEDNERLAAMYYNEYVDARENLRIRNISKENAAVDIWPERGIL
ncbi:MAG: hypothetical protein E7218_05110 [Anaerofustis stercorihominis]|nr:hypothetical protein [Anaerofustis stercorihominis]